MTSLSLFTFMHWRRKWQPTPVFLPGESQGWGSLVGCRLWGRTESDMTERLTLSLLHLQGRCIKVPNAPGALIQRTLAFLQKPPRSKTNGRSKREERFSLFHALKEIDYRGAERVVRPKQGTKLALSEGGKQQWDGFSSSC